VKALSLILLAILLSSCQSVPAQDAREVQSRSFQGSRTLLFPTSLADWESRAEALRTRLLTTTGLLPKLPTLPRQAYESLAEEHDRYTVKTVSLISETGLRVDGSLYTPLSDASPKLAVLLSHGHKPDGRYTHDENFSQQAFARHLAQNGVAVFSYSMIGYDESREIEHKGLDERWHLWGLNLMGLQLQNSRAALNYLISEVQPKRVAMVGWSGGGTQTYLLSAIDDRISASLPCLVLSTTTQDTCACGGAPTFRLSTSSPELAALTAPRPQLVVTANDFTYDFPARGLPFVRFIYFLYQAEDSVQSYHLQTQWHNFNAESRQACYRFLAGQFELEISLEESPAPFPAPSYSEEPQLTDLTPIVKKEKQRIEDALSEAPPQTHLWEYGRAYKAAFPLEFPQRVTVEKSTAEDWLVSRRNTTERIPCWIRHTTPDKPWTVLLTSGGIPEAKSLADNYAGNLLALSPLGTGERSVRAELPKENPTSYNLSLPLEQMQDCLTAIAVAHRESGGKVKVVAVGSACSWGILVRPFLPVEVDTELHSPKLPKTDDELVRDFFVPLFRRVGGYRTALALSAQSYLTVIGHGLETEEAQLKSLYQQRWQRKGLHPPKGTP
jgi:hypothetical protein